MVLQEKKGSRVNNIYKSHTLLGCFTRSVLEGAWRSKTKVETPNSDQPAKLFCTKRENGIGNR